MTDEARPPKGEARPPKGDAAGTPKRPRKPAARKPAAKKPAAKGTGARKPAAKGTGARKPAARGPAAGERAAKESPATEPPTPPEGETQAFAPDVAATQLIPKAPTEALPEADLPAAPAFGPAPPAPPFAPLPRTVARAGGGGRNPATWLIVAVAAVAALAVVAAVLVWLSPFAADGGEQFVGDWAPAGGGGGGLVVSVADGDFTVSMYDEALELLGSYPADRDGDALTYRFTDAQSERGEVTATLTYDGGRDVLTMRLTSGGSQDAPVDYVRVEALQAALPPAPSPTPTTAPTASPSASPTGSPSPSPSPSETDTATLDQQVVDGVSAIYRGVVDWAAANGSVFPAATEVSLGGAIAPFVPGWPMNPFTGQPMTSGSSKGDYTYELLDGGRSCRITGHLSDGTFTVP